MATSILFVTQSDDRVDRMRSEFPDEGAPIISCSELPPTLQSLGDPTSMITTMVVSLATTETYPTSVVRFIRNRWPWVSLLLVDGPASAQIASATVKAGAQEYLSEERSTVENIIETVTQILRSRPSLRAGNPVIQYVSEGKLVGTSDGMQTIYTRLGIASKTNLSVLLYGEPGTGKTLTAQAIHAQSTGRDTPLMMIDCRCLTAGYARELFFGDSVSCGSGDPDHWPVALRDFVGGTVVLDHLDEADNDVQSVILSALETQNLVPREQRLHGWANIRFIGIMSRLPSPNDFRANLYYRLAELSIPIPPLRTRTEDVLPLARYFLKTNRPSEDAVERTFSADAKSALSEYSWPGNVRQLENVVNRSVRISSRSTIEREDLLLPDHRPTAHSQDISERAERSVYPPNLLPYSRPQMEQHSAPQDSDPTTLSSETGTSEVSFGWTEDNIPSLEQLKKQAVKRAYKKYEGDVDRAAVALDIGRSTMYRMIKRYDLRDDDS